MTAPLDARLSTRDWISASAAMLRKQGVDPRDRLHYTGHTTALARAYLPTIGNWARLEGDDFIDVERPHHGMIKVRYGAFREFKSARRLLFGREFELLHGRIVEGPWMHAELSWRVVEEQQQAFLAASGTEASLGLCARRAAERALHGDVAPIGLLPVEIALYARMYDVFLATHLLQYDEWRAFPTAKKLAYWSAGMAPRCHWSLEYFAGVEARRTLPFSSQYRGTTVRRPARPVRYTG